MPVATPDFEHPTAEITIAAISAPAPDFNIIFIALLTLVSGFP